MDESIKNSIKARYDAFEISYVLTSDMKKEIDDLFDQIEEFGKTCKDAMDFETKFSSSPLNQEYVNMFTKVAKKCKVKGLDTNDESKAKRVAEEVGSEAKYLAKDLTMPARRRARMEFDSKMRNTPLGKIEQANNTFWLFKKIKNKVKPSKNDIENNDD